MRLSEYVASHGIDQFTTDDFDFVSKAVNSDPKRLILVGGQAIEVWGIYFGVDRPTGDAAPLTDDTDWLGSEKDARWLCDLLGNNVELTIAGAHDNGPSTAVAYLQRPDGRILMMDFLRCIVGPENAEVLRLAVPIGIRGATLYVLHPLLCLHSRLSNLETLSSKRNGNGLAQADWAARIVERYIQRLISDKNLDAAQKACQYVAKLAEYKSGPWCYENFGIDPLTAITDEIVGAIGGRFVTEEWPRTLQRIQKKREKWLEQAAARAARRSS